MRTDDEKIWGSNPPEPWVRAAADRWANLVERAAYLFMDLLASSPLPRTETEILTLIWKEPESAEPAIIAERLRVSRQSMTGLLDKLETGGYVNRAAHPTDRRRTIVRLKPKGVSTIRSFVSGVLSRQAALFASRPEAEVKATLSAFESMIDLAANWMPSGKIKNDE